MTSSPLAGRHIVVTRATAQAAPLVDAIAARGGTPVSLPLLEIVDAEDGGRALRSQVESLRSHDWLVVLSPNAARRIVSSCQPADAHLAVIASGTAEVFERAGWDIDLIPSVGSSTGLLSAFEGIDVAGSVVIAQAEGGRAELADGLRARGVDVVVVTAYRNQVPHIDRTALDHARQADVVVFASPSAVDRYVAAAGLTPEQAVCIGAVTASTASAAGFTVTSANEPSVQGLIAAIETVCARVG